MILCIVCGAIGAAETRIVTLRGGSIVTGPVLRDNPEGVVIDLGHDVLVLPRDRILEMSAPEAAADAAIQVGDIYQIGHRSPAPIGEQVEAIGDAVVKVTTPGGLGSGFIISPQGHVITNYHVVEKQTRIGVTLFDQTADGFERIELEKVRILALHPLRDLALLQLDAEELAGRALTVLTLAQERPNPGDLTFAIGNPLGLERSVSQGIVSSTTRTNGHLRFVQSDIPINPGNSGGPLLNARGEVIGVVCASFTYFDGLGFGIPCRELIDFLDNRDAFVYDPSQPQNGFVYLDPPFIPSH